MACTIRSPARGYSGVSVRLVRTLVDMLNLGVVPTRRPRGRSATSTATAHIGLAVFGDGQAWSRGKLLPGADLIDGADIAGAISVGPAGQHPRLRRPVAGAARRQRA